MNVLHLIAMGGTGGIEVLNREYAGFSKHTNTYLFAWGQNGETSSFMIEQGFDVIELNASKKDILKTYLDIKKICIDKKIDVIVVHNAAPVLHIIAMVIKVILPKVKILTYAHGNAVDMCRIKDKKGYKLRKFVLKKSLQRADKVIAISKSVEESLYEIFKTPKNKIELIYNGVDTQKFYQHKRTYNKPAKLIYVGRLVEEKGVQVILQGLSHLPKEIAYTFNIVGDGPYRESLEVMVKEFNLEEKVEFLGNCLNVPELLIESDFFIHLPVYEEGFGITIIEAMASGLVCICAKSGAIPEIITNEVNGFIVNKEDPKAFSNKLKELLCNIDDEYINEISKQAIKTANNFSMKVYSEKIDNLINSVN